MIKAKLLGLCLILYQVQMFTRFGKKCAVKVSPQVQEDKFPKQSHGKMVYYVEGRQYFCTTDGLQAAKYMVYGKFHHHNHHHWFLVCSQ